jgi:hypothetical protein
MNRMLTAARAGIAADAAWLRERSEGLARAEGALGCAFAVLADD